MKIQVENLTVSIGKKQILKNISMIASSGKMTAIIGPNGSGKSTLLKTIYGYLKDHSGNIYIGNKLVLDIPRKEMATKVSVVTQFHESGFDFRVKEIVGLGRSVHQKLMARNSQQDEDIIKQSLQSVGLFHKKDHYVRELSGGERRLVELARAMAQQGRCMILDEPGNHLDIMHQISLMRTIKKEKITVLAALHDIELAASYFDQVYVLNQGLIVAKGKPEDVLTEELIHRVYGVKSNITHNAHTNHLNISYYK